MSDFCTIEEALDELRAGRMIVLVDDEHRENEGDLVIAAEKVTPEAINFMIRNGCGILCLAHVAGHLRPAAPGADARATTSIRRPRRSRRTSTPAPASPPAPRRFDRARTVQVAIDDRTDAERPDPRQGARPRPAGPRGRRAGPGRPHRGQRRPGPAGRLQGGRRHLRDHARRRHAWPACPTCASSASSTA